MPDRYAHQILFPPIGPEGQERLRASTVSIVGLGALGSTSAGLLARAGVGRLRLFDRDFVELDNLQRQTLYDEEDVRGDLPKAEAARRKLERINSEVQLEAHVADVVPQNVAAVFEASDLVLDGTDNFETRMLLNDAAVERGVPWVYAGCVGSSGMVMPIRPGRSACFRCVVPSLPRPGALPTCDTAGILNAAAALVAAAQVAEALKVLTANEAALLPGLLHVDVWEGRFLVLRAPRLADCAACVQRRLDHLRSGPAGRAATLCGRNAVQIPAAPGSGLDLGALERRLAAAGRVRRNPYLLKFAVEGFEMAIFPDGRAIVQGTDDPARARSLYARFVGS